MKALTIRQPWASLIVAGVKDVENRSWPVPDWLFGEPLAIHSAARLDKAAHAARATVLAGEAVPGGHFIALDAQSAQACGIVLGSVEVVGCHHADDCDEALRIASGNEHVRMFCSRWAEPDAYHWVITQPEIWQPMALTGRQGLWDLPAEAVPA